MVTDVLELAELDQDLVHLRNPIFRPAINAWARCEKRIDRLYRWLEAFATEERPGDIDAVGEMRPAVAALDRLEAQAIKHRQALGVDPSSMARLRRDAGSARASFDLAALLATIGDHPATTRSQRHDRTQHPDAAPTP